jgi:uncharacterized RDD family membrane protein YckC
VETPEGVELALRVAGPVPRLLAWVLDLLLRGTLYVALAIVAATLGRSGLGLLLIALFAIEWLYPVVFEVWRDGATPGKRRMGLVVLHRDGTPVRFTASAIRNLIRFVDFLPFGYGIGLVSMLVTRDFQRLGDLAAGTVVLHRDDELAGYRVPAAAPLAPPVPLDLAEQRAVIEYAERLGTWTEARATELAGIVRPLTGTAGREAMVRLLGIAAWLLGRR